MPSSRGSSQPRDRTHGCYVSCIDWQGSLPLVLLGKPRLGSYFLLQGISTQGWNLHILNWQVDSLPLSHQRRSIFKIFIIKKAGKVHKICYNFLYIRNLYIYTLIYRHKEFMYITFMHICLTFIRILNHYRNWKSNWTIKKKWLHMRDGIQVQSLEITRR